VKQHEGKHESNKENMIDEPQIMMPKSNKSQLPQSLKKSFVQDNPSMIGNQQNMSGHIDDSMSSRVSLVSGKSGAMDRQMKEVSK
jgi:hypothetical protein